MHLAIPSPRRSGVDRPRLVFVLRKSYSFRQFLCFIENMCISNPLDSKKVAVDKILVYLEMLNDVISVRFQ